MKGFQEFLDMQHITCLLVVVDGSEDGDGRLADNCFSFDALIFFK